MPGVGPEVDPELDAGPPVMANVPRRVLHGPERIATVFGDAQVSAPQPERFRAAHLARRYGEVLLERATFTRIRVDLAPSASKLRPGLVLLRVDQGRARVMTPGRSWVVHPGQATVFHTNLDGAVDIEDGNYRQVWMPIRGFQPDIYPRLRLALDQPIGQSPLGDAMWAFVDALLDQPESVPALWNDAAAAPIERAITDIVTQWMLQPEGGAGSGKANGRAESKAAETPRDSADLRAACIRFFQANRATRNSPSATLPGNWM